MSIIDYEKNQRTGVTDRLHLTTWDDDGSALLAVDSDGLSTSLHLTRTEALKLAAAIIGHLATPQTAVGEEGA